ncbi:MAG: zinc ABC transporter substrate-binding protein [Planctomycetota bacterium]
MSDSACWHHRRRLLTALGCGVYSAFTGCGRAATSRKQHVGDGPMRVVATTALVADLVRNIAGPNRVQVVSLMGEGVDPHLYKGSPRDVRDLAGADLVFAGGLHLEGKLIGVLHRLGRQKPVHLLGDELTISHESKKLPDPWIRDDSMPDPHCWFDVKLWKLEAELLSQIMIDYDPVHRSEFQSNLRNYSAQMDQLDSEIHLSIGRIPADRRLLITSHDAFRYFGRAYGIQVEGIQGLSTESESGVRRTNQLVDLVISRQIPAIFVETSVSDDNVKALVEGARARGHNLRIGGSLYSDAPGALGKPEGTYAGMLRHNVRTFVQAMTDDRSFMPGQVQGVGS